MGRSGRPERGSACSPREMTYLPRPCHEMEARMLRDDVLAKIASQREALNRFHVKTLAIFGSVASGERCNDATLC